MCCCAWFIPQKYLVHYFFRISFSRNNAFWLDQIDALEPQQALYIPSEKGYVVLEYVTAAFNFILASLLSAIIVILAIDSGCHFWWLLIFYPVIIYSSFAIYIAIRWSFIIHTTTLITNVQSDLLPRPQLAMLCRSWYIDIGEKNREFWK